MLNRFVLYQKARRGQITRWTWFGIVKYYYDENPKKFDYAIIIRAPFTHIGTYTHPLTFRRVHKSQIRKVFIFRLYESGITSKFKLDKQSYYEPVL